MLEGRRDGCARGLRQEYVAPVLPWLATALRTQAEAVPAYRPRRRRQLRAGRGGRSRAPCAWPAATATTCRTPCGRRPCWPAIPGAAAPGLLDESLAVAEAQGARHEHAQTLLARGRLGGCTAGEAADDMPRPARAGRAGAARRATARRGRPLGEVTLSLVDRFEQIWSRAGGSPRRCPGRPSWPRCDGGAGAAARRRRPRRCGRQREQQQVGEAGAARRSRRPC